MDLVGGKGPTRGKYRHVGRPKSGCHRAGRKLPDETEQPELEQDAQPSHWRLVVF